ncbi:MAG TPA: hypothetical protein VIV11_22075 [Kofleriaceae bacterium]
MRWVIGVAILAGCGRIAFDPLGGSGGDDTSGGDGSLSGDGTTVTDDGGTGSGAPQYVTGGSGFRFNSATASVTVPAISGTDLAIVVVIAWTDGTSLVSNVTDTNGNTYAIAGGQIASGGLSQVMYYAVLPSPGGFTLDVTFTQPVPTAYLKVAAYQGIDPTLTLINANGANGTSATASTPNLAVTGPAVLVAGSISSGTAAGPGPGYAQRTASGGGILQDRYAPTGGSYNATAPLTGTAPWILELAALRPR